MKLINNNLKIVEEYLLNNSKESYIVEDLEIPGNKLFLELLEGNTHQPLINDFINSHIKYKNISHKYILKTIDFKRVETINLKQVYGNLFYVLSEHTELERLDKIHNNFTEVDMATVFIKLFQTIDYLHFRGFTYNFLTPDNIFVSKDCDVKISSIGKTIKYSYYNENYIYNHKYLAPELFNSEINIDFKSDYFSLGILLEDFMLPVINKNNSKAWNSIEKMIKNLKLKNPDLRLDKIRNYIDNLINLFNVDYKVDYKNERQKLYFDLPSIGFGDHINKAKEIDKSIKDGTSIINGLLISGSPGTGKAKLLNEVSNRMRLAGRHVYSIDIEKDDIIKEETQKRFITRLIEIQKSKYKLSTDKRIVETSSENNTIQYDLTILDEKYKLLNKLAEDFISMSRMNPVYITIRNLSVADLETFTSIDFLVSRIKNNNVVFLFTLDLETIKSYDLKSIINNWIEKEKFVEFKLNNLDEINTIKLVESLVGSTDFPKDFSKLLYRESLGNPRYLDVLIKHFYDTSEIFINEDGDWEIKTKDYDDIYFPQNFGETIKTSYNTLDNQEIELLEIISCFEYPATESIVMETMNIEKHSYKYLIESLIEKKIVNRISMEKDKRLVFCEGELKRYIYNLISDKKKIEYHNKISEIFLEKKDKGQNIDFNSIVKQLSGAGKLDILYETIQERISNERVKNGQSVIIFLELLFSKLDSKKHHKRLEVLEQLIQCYLSIGKYLELENYIDRLETISRELDLKNKLINSTLYRFEIYVRTDNLSQAKKLSKKLRSIPEIKANVYYLLEYIRIEALFMQALAKNLETIRLLKKAIDLAIRSNNKSVLGDLYNMLGIAYYFEGRHNEALDNYELAIKGYEHSLDSYNVVKPLSNIGSIYNEVFSLPAKALEYFVKSNKIAEENNLLNGQSIFLNNIGEAYFNMADYKNSEIYYKKSIQLSKINKDRTMKYLTIINLGFNSLNQGKLREAIQIFHTLRQINKDKPILDSEINMRYTNFLGNFYMALGDLTLGKKFSQISLDKSKDVSVIEYMKACYRIFTIDSIMQMSINPQDLEDIIIRFRNEGNVLDRVYFILNIGFLSLRLEDNNAFDYLSKEFKTIDNPNIQEVYKDDIRVLNNLYSYDVDTLIETLDFLNRKDIHLSISKIRYLSQLGRLFYEEKLYNYSIKALLACLDLFYKTISNLGIEGYEEKLEAYYSIDYVKLLLNKVFVIGLGVDFSLNKINYKRNYYDLRLYLDLLSHEDIYRIYKKEEDVNIFKDLPSLIGSFYSDYENNIKQLLKFISFHTMAESVYLIVFNYPDIGEKSEYHWTNDTNKLELNPVLLNAVKDGRGILINNTCGDNAKSGYEEYLSDDQTALMGIPIIEPEKKLSEKERRSNNKKKDAYGSIFISTTSGINMFNREKFNLITSISKLIYLNLENSRLFRQSNYDKLTGALTRASIEKILDDLIKEYTEVSSNFAVMMLDIDKFKLINDTYGHQVGDKVLKSIGNILRENLRDTDFIGRYGGEEFLILIDNISIENSLNVAQKILYSIENYKDFSIKGKVTASIGISKFPEHTILQEDLIYKADQALYFAKEVLGRNQVAIWDNKMEGIENLQSYVHNIAFGGFANNISNIISLVDLSLMNRQEYSIEDKIYSYLGMLIDGTEAEIASLFFLNSKNLNQQYSRKNGIDTWLRDVKINNELLRRSIKSNESFTFIEWHPSTLVDNKSDSFNIKSLLLSPVLVNGRLRGIVYLEVPLKRKEFTSENIGFVETLSGVFSCNL